jgi:hypothetical protein
MYKQLTLWDLTVDIAGKIKAEKKAGVQVKYHFCGRPLPMYAPGHREL